jgi:hypothetical protein
MSTEHKAQGMSTIHEHKAKSNDKKTGLRTTHSLFAFGLSATLTPKALNLLFPLAHATRRYLSFLGS